MKLFGNFANKLMKSPDRQDELFLKKVGQIWK